MSYGAEEKWLLADAMLDEGRIADGKLLLEEILEEEPDYGRAHSHMGFIYAAHYIDFGRAERHLKLALEYAPEYPPPYLHMTRLLFELCRWEELVTHIQWSLQVEGIDEAVLYEFLGLYYETHFHYARAMECYEKAITCSYNGPYIHALRDSHARARAKAPKGLRVRMAMRNLRATLML